jgi:hypothetical protein
MTKISLKSPARPAIVGISLFGVCLSGLAQTVLSTQALPDATQFMQSVAANFKDQYDEQTLLKGYVYRAFTVEEELDGKGRVRTSRTTEFDTYLFPQGPFRWVLTRDGTPLSKNESRQQEDAFTAHVDGRQIQTADGPWSRSQRSSPASQRDMIEDIPDAFLFELLRRETVDGRPAIVVGFGPRDGADYSSRLGKLLLPKVAGRAWIDEEDQTLVRVEAEVVDDVKVGVFGLLAKIRKGTVHVQEWFRTDSGKWLPWKREMEFEARSFLVKTYHRRILEERSDYRKFSLNDTTGPSGGAPQQNR